MASKPNSAMKHASLVVKGNEQEARVLSAIARYKGQSIDVEQAEGTPSVTDRNLTVEGFWPAVEYLEERFPYPPVLPELPVRRALVRSMVEGLRTYPDNVLPRLLGHPTEFIISDTPSLLDFVVYGVADGQKAWAKMFKSLTSVVSAQPIDA
jgi:hypothetical protein